MIPQGFKFSAVNAGIKSPETTRLDLGLIMADRPANAAAVFTSNAVKAAPVMVGMELIKQGNLRAVLVNSGNANACTGQPGFDHTRGLMQELAKKIKINASEVFPMSTGVIGVELPYERINAALGKLVDGLGDDYESFERAIMTTDTVPKIVTRKAGEASVLGFAKGSGMIAPGMATTLAIILTDADLTTEQLNAIIKDTADSTFNAITVDGDMSTNDTLLALASGYVREPFDSIRSAIHSVIQELAQLIVRDGEGATKFITLHVGGALNDADARTAAMSVANSLLVKTAFFGADPNWGRIMCALGYSGAQIDQELITMSICDLPVVAGGMESPFFNEDLVHAALKQRDISVAIDLGLGDGSFTAWTSDISYGYVEINADYRT